MGFSEKFFELLLTTRRSYKGVPVNIFGMPTFGLFDKRMISSSVYRFKKQGFILEKEGGFFITAKGRIHANKKHRELKNFSGNNMKSAPKNLLVMYDIPHTKKKERDWFRRHLKKFDFIMIQKSVWVGPAPLPKEFLDYVKEIGIKETFKTFKLEKTYTLK